MGKELEVKVLNVNVEELENKLKKIGAELVKKEYQRNIIFDTEDRFIMNKHNAYLRLREVKDLNSNEVSKIFTLKKNISKGSLRENEEIETIIQDGEAIISILEHLNLNIIHEGTKKRISYKYENILYEIDIWNKETYPHPYLEIEVNNEEDLEKAIELLELDKKNVTTKSISQLRNEVGYSDL